MNTTEFNSILRVTKKTPVYKITNKAKMVQVGTLREGDEVLIVKKLKTTDILHPESTKELDLYQLAITVKDETIENFYVVGGYDNESTFVFQPYEGGAVEDIYEVSGLITESRSLTNNGKVYYGPGEFFREVHTLNKGEKFTIIGKYGGYAHIKKDGRWDGYTKITNVEVNISSGFINVPNDTLNEITVHLSDDMAKPKYDNGKYVEITPDMEVPDIKEVHPELFQEKKEKPVLKEVVKTETTLAPKKEEPKSESNKIKDIITENKEWILSWMGGDTQVLLLKLNADANDTDKLQKLIETIKNVCESLAVSDDVALDVDPELNEDDVAIIRNLSYPNGTYLPAFLSYPTEKGRSFGRKLQKTLLAKGIRVVEFPSYN